MFSQQNLHSVLKLCTMVQSSVYLTSFFIVPQSDYLGVACLAIFAFGFGSVLVFFAKIATPPLRRILLTSVGVVLVSIVFQLLWVAVLTLLMFDVLSETSTLFVVLASLSSLLAGLSCGRLCLSFYPAQNDENMVDEHDFDFAKHLIVYMVSILIPVFLLMLVINVSISCAILLLIFAFLNPIYSLFIFKADSVTDDLFDYSESDSREQAFLRGPLRHRPFIMHFNLGLCAVCFLAAFGFPRLTVFFCAILSATVALLGLLVYLAISKKMPAPRSTDKLSSVLGIFVVLITFICPFLPQLVNMALLFLVLLIYTFSFSIVLTVSALMKRVPPMYHRACWVPRILLGCASGAVLGLVLFMLPLDHVEYIAAALMIMLITLVNFTNDTASAEWQELYLHTNGINEELNLENVPNLPYQAIVFEDLCGQIAEQFKFTKREKEVFVLLAKGRNAEYISENLYVSISTARTHIYHIFEKIGVKKQQELLDFVDSYNGKDVTR